MANYNESNEKNTPATDKQEGILAWLKPLAWTIIITVVLVGTFVNIIGVTIPVSSLFALVLLFLVIIPVIFLFMPTKQQVAENLFCTNCGNSVSTHAKGCPSCGASPTGHRKFCRRCGTALNPEQVICVKCKADVLDPTERLEAKTILSLFGGLALGICVLLFGNTTFTFWGGIAILIMTVAGFLLNLAKLIKK